ncbi:MAG: hypothetical protein HC933_04985, partial [Pleurocapsa sp. SU_196_0]|nr:hypothetical protein [Pleurocapsa sp. SU_196_0]
GAAHVGADVVARDRVAAHRPSQRQPVVPRSLMTSPLTVPGPVITTVRVVQGDNADANRKDTTFRFDSSGLLTQREMRDFSPFSSPTVTSANATANSARILTTRYTYTASGSTQSITDPAGRTDRYTYDAAGNLTRADTYTSPDATIPDAARPTPTTPITVVSPKPSPPSQELVITPRSHTRKTGNNPRTSFTQPPRTRRSSWPSRNARTPASSVMPPFARTPRSTTRADASSKPVASDFPPRHEPPSTNTTAVAPRTASGSARQRKVYPPRSTPTS